MNIDNAIFKEWFNKLIDYKIVSFSNGSFYRNAYEIAFKIKKVLFETLHSIEESELKKSSKIIESIINQNTQFINEVSEKIEINRQRQIDIIKEIELYKESNIELIDIPFADQNKKRYFDILIDLADALKGSINSKVKKNYVSFDLKNKDSERLEDIIDRLVLERCIEKKDKTKLQNIFLKDNLNVKIEWKKSTSLLNEVLKKIKIEFSINITDKELFNIFEKIVSKNNIQGNRSLSINDKLTIGKIFNK